MTGVGGLPPIGPADHIRLPRSRFEWVCYHPLFLFNHHGDCLAAKLRPGKVHSAEDWDELLLPEIERQQAEGLRGYAKVVYNVDLTLEEAKQFRSTFFQSREKVSHLHSRQCRAERSGCGRDRTM